MRRCRSGVAPMDRKWRRWQLTGPRGRAATTQAMEGSSRRWEGRLAAPRFIEREGHGNIAAAPVISAHDRAEHDRQFRSPLLKRGRPYSDRWICRGVAAAGLGSAQKKRFELAGKRASFLFLYFLKSFFTEIYFRFHNLQFCTPTARLRVGRVPAANWRGGRDLNVNKIYF